VVSAVGAGKVCPSGADKGSPQWWGELAGLSRGQDGAVSVAQFAALGFDRRRLTLLVRQGRFVRRHRGVYLDALMKPTQRGRLLAALLALDGSAFLSRRTALALHGVRLVNLREIELTIVAEHTPRHAGLVVHRTRVTPEADEIRLLDGLRVASPSLALLESASRETDQELDRLIAELARRRLLDLARIDAAIDRRKGLPGLPRLRAALGRYRPPSAGEPEQNASALERDFAAWLRDEHPEIPPPERYVRLGPWEVDFLWPAQQVVVETDGEPYHRTPRELERDRIKDAWLQRHDHRVLRVTGFRFTHDRAGIHEDLAAMLGAI
jgi:very-short-patch-repair endonuclease